MKHTDAVLAHLSRLHSWLHVAITTAGLKVPHPQPSNLSTQSCGKFIDSRIRLPHSWHLNEDLVAAEKCLWIRCGAPAPSYVAFVAGSAVATTGLASILAVPSCNMHLAYRQDLTELTYRRFRSTIFQSGQTFPTLSGKSNPVWTNTDPPLYLPIFDVPPGSGIDCSKFYQWRDKWSNYNDELNDDLDSECAVW